MSSFVPSPNQQAVFDFVADPVAGNAIVTAVAGAGKTTTIVKALDFMSGYVFLGAYNTKMASELKERVSGRPGVMAGTFHSAGFRQLKFSYKNAALRLDDKKCLEIADEIVKEREDLDGMQGTVARVVSMAKQRGLGALCDMNDNAVWDEMIDHFGLDENLPEGFRRDQVIAFSRAVLRRSNATVEVIDYDDMVYLPLLRNLKMLQNDWVLIDEAQDTNPTRRALAKKMLKPGGRLIAVGDPHQAIFGFTGADNDSLEIIGREFNCVELPLTITYRCPKAIVEHARQWVSHIEAHESAPEGEVGMMHLSRTRDGAMNWTPLIEAARAGDAILCRNNKYLVSACFAFIRAGVSAKIEGRAIGQGLISLTNRWKVRTLDALSDRLQAYASKEIEKALAAKQEQRADRVADQVDTLMVLIERCREDGSNSVDALKVLVDRLFSDDVSSKAMVTLCSAHRSKGLEWDRVFLLGRSELMPSPFARQPWQMEQEINLIYVAVTRAKQTLIEVSGIA